MDTYEEPLSKQMGIVTQETVVSRLIAAALAGHCGAELLRALLAPCEDELEVFATDAELTVDRSRLDVVVVFRQAARVRALVIEAKVKAEQGHGQLDRYLEAIGSPAFVDKALELPALPDAKWERDQLGVDPSSLLYLTVAEEHDVPERVTTRTYTEWLDRLDHERLQREGDLATQLLIDALRYLGGRLGKQAEFTNNVCANTMLQDFSEQNWEEFALEKQLSRRVTEVFLELFNEFNRDLDADRFDWYWASRGNWSREFAYYKAAWRNFCPFWSDNETGQLSSLIWAIVPASFGSKSPSIRLRVRFQVEPYHKKTEFEAKFPDEVDAFRGLKEKFGGLVASAAEQNEKAGYQGRRSEHQVGYAEVALDPNGTLEDAAERIWEKSIELGLLVDEALGALRAEGWIEGPWITGQHESREPAFQRANKDR